MTVIQQILYTHHDPDYAKFIAKLIPTLPTERFMGIRMPEFKKIVKELPDKQVVDEFLQTLPHTYYEENILHGILIGRIRDFDECLEKVNQFLPYVDNWAVCDGLNPSVFKKHAARLRDELNGWITSEETYTRRFGLHMVMAHFLDEHFDPVLLEQAATLRSEEYYVNMMTAWLFAEALVKQWSAAIPYIEQHRLDRWTNNKAIQKAIESYRITEDQKAYLRTLKIR